MEEYPNTPLARGLPFPGIKDARPELTKASKTRFKQEDVPFNVEKALLREGRSILENFDANWGIE